MPSQASDYAQIQALLHGVADIMHGTGQIDFELVPPDASSLAESLRAFSYDLPSAVADLVDNSITALARNVWIDFFWNGSGSVIAVSDDGCGMTPHQLVQAMKAGSQSPRQARQAHDLGRFGLGLKTASFSQARRVTVRTKTDGGGAATRCWDLDHIASVKDWQLLKTGDKSAEKHFHRLEGLSHGTTVVWQKMDRLIAGQRTEDEHAQRLFYDGADAVKRHLSMVFHRLMSGTSRVSFFINDIPVPDWDPFLESEPATQMLGTEKLQVRGHPVEVSAFVLPHHSKLSKAAHDRAAGTRGWNAHQGFYVYRNRRLLVPGDWLGLGWRKEEHYKLARVRIDITNALDEDWAIDVTKSRAYPPPGLRPELRRIGEYARRRAKEVYRHRGARLTHVSEMDKIFLWEQRAKNGRTFYRLNDQHPLLKQVVASSSNPGALRALLRLIEETIPVPLITITNSEDPDTHSTPFDGTSEALIRETMHEAYRALKSGGYTQQQALSRLASIWPFELFPALLQALHEDDND